MAQENEKLTLEYVARFEDGFKPCLRVYCPEDAGKKIHVLDANFELVFNVKSLLKSPEFPLRSSRVVHVYSKIQPVEKLKDGQSLANWEQETIGECIKYRWNLARVNLPRCLELAVENHKELYLAQFDPLDSGFRDLVVKFMKGHPGYFSSTFDA